MCLHLDDAGRDAAARHIDAELRRQAKGGAMPFFCTNAPGVEPKPLDPNEFFNRLAKEDRSAPVGCSKEGF